LSIYVAQLQSELKQYTNVDANAVEHLDIYRYWNDRRASVPRLAAYALRTLDVPVSSADAERAFSSYNKLVCSSRLSLSDDSIRVLHSAAWNGDIILVVDLRATTTRSVTDYVMCMHVTIMLNKRHSFRILNVYMLRNK
jgi:hypothetical protein